MNLCSEKILKFTTAPAEGTDEQKPVLKRSQVPARFSLSGSCFMFLVLLMCVVFAIPVFADGTTTDPLSPLALGEIRAGGEIGRRIDLTIQKNLLALDIDNDFLRLFREKNSPGGFNGIGKLIDAAVRFAAYNNTLELIDLKRYLIAELIKHQKSDGYIGMQLTDARMWEYWDIHEMSFIMWGLVNDYRHFGEKSSLEAAQRTADYIIKHWQAEPERLPCHGKSVIHLCTIGFEQAMLGLYEETGDNRYLDFCVEHRKLADWSYPIVLGRHGKIEGHVYAYLARCLAQLELYHLQPDEKLLTQSRKVLDFLTKKEGLVITGAGDRSECWQDSQDGLGELGETCATAYLVWFMDRLMRLESNSYYGDIMERIIYNSLFGAQSTDGRKIRYWTAFEGPRLYFQRDDYCCPGNFRRIVSDLPSMIYYHTKNGIWVNLYNESSAKVELRKNLSINLRQETDYPNSGKVIIHLDPSKPADFSLQLRIPRWCDKATVTINGSVIKESVKSGSFYKINRQWKKGDRVELNMPMSWRVVKGRKSQHGRVAVMRGPMVFCLNRKRNPDIPHHAQINLRDIKIDITSLEGPIKDHTVRPDGMACRLRAYTPGRSPTQPTDMELILTEFADPGGQAIYFQVPQMDGAVDDELIQMR